jgi:rubredoxin
MAKKMSRYRCVACGYIYDPARGEPKNGIMPGTAFKDLPVGYICPVCGARARIGKRAFDKLDEPGSYRCVACDYVYDPARGEPKNGIRPGTPFRELAQEYTCPVCGAYAKVGKTAFVPVD